MSLAILFHFLCAQHVSDINISIIRRLRLFCWITTLVVLFLVQCVLEFRFGWLEWYPCCRLKPATRMGRGLALFFHDCGTRRGWVVSSTFRPHFTSRKDSVPILQEAGWTPGPVWTGGKSRPHRDSIPDRPARSQSLYRLSYRAHSYIK